MARLTVDEILGPDGDLARAVPGFEARAGQLALAHAAAETLAEGGYLLAEAGTGTGKTLAYLAAALTIAGGGHRVVVSTATRTLQDQILRQDLPRLRVGLAGGRDPLYAVALLKGRANYLCLLRLEEMQALPAALWPPGLDAIDTWATTTTSGDRADLATLPEDHPLWSQLTTTSETCLGNRCPLHGRCFVTRARAAAEAADLIVVNHHLYFGDAAVRAAGGELLPPHDAVIFDEAHAVPEVAAEFFGRHVSTQRIASLLADLAKALAPESVDRPLRLAAQTLAHGVSAAAERLFAAVRPAGAEGRVPWRAEDCNAEVQRRHLVLDSALLALASALPRPGNAPALESLALLGPRTAALRDDLALLLEPRAPGWVFFREARGGFVSLGGQPVEAGEPLRRHIYPAVPAAVFTSATLAVGGDFGFLRRRLGLGGDPEAGAWVDDWPRRFDDDWPDDRGASGLAPYGDPMASGLATGDPHASGQATGGRDQDPPPICRPAGDRTASGLLPSGDRDLALLPVREAIFPSPFDYPSQVRLYLPRELPIPDAPGHADAGEAHIRALTTLTLGRAFVLFTSHRALEHTHARLRRDFPFPLLRQGEAPRTALVERFRQTPGAVLLGTSTFWEGVDVVGPALSLVIIDKLPFESPADPVLQARMEQCRARGGNPFTELQVPAAALALKQGFGRLIRSRSDRGIVAVLDVRLSTRGYGARLLAGLPPAPVVRHLADLRAWWEGLGGADTPPERQGA